MWPNYVLSRQTTFSLQAKYRNDWRLLVLEAESNKYVSDCSGICYEGLDNRKCNPVNFSIS